MKLLADESVDARLVARLRADGHEVISIQETAPSITDPDVLEHSIQLNIVLFTEDKDFGELVYREKRPHAGILLLRLNDLTIEAKYAALAEAITLHGSILPSAYSVLSESGFRTRPKPV